MIARESFILADPDKPDRSSMKFVAVGRMLAAYAGVNAIHHEFDTWARRVASVGSWAAEPGRRRLAALRSSGLPD